MPRFHEPYTLYTRRMQDGRKVYYYRARDPDTGARLPGLSTGKATAREAYAWCDSQLAAGTLIPGPRPEKPAAEVRRSRRHPTLAEYVREHHWWIWEEDKAPECEYCKSQLDRSSPEAPAISRKTAHGYRRIYELHIAPAHSYRRIDQITAADCEALMASWRDQGASTKSVNVWASVYRIMLGEAERLDIIERSPWSKVRTYQAGKGGKGILTIDEYKALMAPDPASRGAIWNYGDAIYYDINLLASVTGLRSGECLALHREDVYADHIIVSHSWDIKYGEGPQKTRRGTDVIPVPKYVGDRLVALAAMTPPGGYIFSLSKGERPCTANRVNDALTLALANIKISDSERRVRKISFHSWRAFANTYFRASGVPDNKVRQITRHKSEAMTEHYSAWRLEDFSDISAAQTALVAQLGE